MVGFHVLQGVEEVNERCREVRADAERYSLNTPPLGDVLDACEECLDREFRREFERAVAVAREVPDPTAFHAVRAALLVGAHQHRQLYEVSQWGEQVGLSSGPTFSRHKCAFEDEGVIETVTEKVPEGRPRQRLYLSDRGAEIVESEGLPGLIQHGAVRD